MNNKEHNFISAIVYLHNNQNSLVNFFDNLNDMLVNNFERFEIIAVNDASTDNTSKVLEEWAKSLDNPLTIINMSLYQKREASMNAGLDISIGDYVMEFDYVNPSFDFNLAFKAYLKCLEGNDIVSVCPKKVHLSSKMFYSLYNANSNSIYELKTDIMRVITRRAINRVHATSEYLPYRKAAYATSGFKMATIECEERAYRDKNGRFSLAVDGLALYTSAGYKISIGITAVMLVTSLISLIYTIVIYVSGKPIEGWTTTMLVLTLGFFGLFLILTIVLKYLILILDVNFRKNKYLVEGIKKIQK